MEFNANEITVIEGPNGSGKTTLLNLLTGFLRPISGKIEMYNFKEKPVIGYLDQFSYKSLWLNNTMKETLSLFVTLFNFSEEKIVEYLQILKLDDVINTKIARLSIGEIQRLGLMMTLIHSPQILILDEPTAQLDSNNTNIVMDFLRKIKIERNIIIIIVTHDHRMNLIADKSFSLYNGYIEDNEKSYSTPGEIAKTANVMMNGVIKLPEIIWELMEKPKTVNINYSIVKNEVSIKSNSSSVSEKTVLDSIISRIQSYINHIGGSPQIHLDNFRIINPEGRILNCNPTLDMEGGEIVGIIGDSGTGKSSFLNYLTGNLLKDFKTSGNLTINTGLGDMDNTKKIIYINQTTSLIDDLTLQDHMLLIFGNKFSKKENHLKLFFDYFNLSIPFETKISNLSGGQKFLLAFILGLLLKPVILILDETFANVDPINKDKSINLLEMLAQSGCILIIATHEEKFINICSKQFLFNK